MHVASAPITMLHTEQICCDKGHFGKALAVVLVSFARGHCTCSFPKGPRGATPHYEQTTSGAADTEASDTRRPIMNFVDRAEDDLLKVLPFCVMGCASAMPSSIAIFKGISLRASMKCVASAASCTMFFT